jgi:cobalamin biosynthesis protein CobT
VAYNQWTQFQEFGKFMKGVEGVEQTSETESNWRVKVFKSRRSWKANITEQVPDRRIAWSSEGPKGSTSGVVTFHPLADDLTRVLLSMRYYPQGLFEKTGNIWRAGGRRARLDLKNYRTFITSEGKETGSWRGEIHDGQVTAQPEDEEQEGQQDEGQEGQDQQSPNGAQAQSQDGRQQSEDGSGGSEGEQGSDDGSGEQAQDEGQQDQSEQREDESVSS